MRAAFTAAGKTTEAKASPIGFLAHQDVVPVAPGTDKDWQHPPYDGVIADGFIWGRGACDTKGIIASMISAAERLLEAGTRNFGLLFVVGEERNSAGAVSMLIQ